MSPRATNSLETVEMVMVLEEIFEVVIPDGVAERFEGREIVDWLEAQLSNRRPNNAAREALRELARDQQLPELTEDLDGPWRREQIAAMVRQIFR